MSVQSAGLFARMVALVRLGKYCARPMPSTLRRSPALPLFRRQRTGAPSWSGSLRPLVLALLMAAPGCSEQGEGERCDPDNYDADCESGLACIPLAKLRSGATGAVCCPPNPTSNICRSNDFDINDDAGVGETSTSGTGSEQPDAAMSTLEDSGVMLDASFADASGGDAGETMSLVETNDAGQASTTSSEETPPATSSSGASSLTPSGETLIDSAPKMDAGSDAGG